MSETTASELAELLQAESPAQSDAAWSAFTEKHTKLILHVARSLGGDHDAAMDRYAYVLERLAENNYRRLREYTPDGRTQFTTWLVVVVRRLCLDHHRARYGRPRGSTSEARQRTRRALTDELVSHVDLDRLASDAPNPEQHVVALDLHARLRRAVADLDASDRLLLALRFEDGRSAREIAELMALPTPFHVYRRVNRVLARLRQRMETTPGESSTTSHDATVGTSVRSMKTEE